MYKIYLFIFLFTFSLSSRSQSSIYDLKLKTVLRNIDMSEFRGKNILLVNIGSASLRVSQYSKLKELYQRYKDKALVVICFPSNDFNGEPKNDEDIQKFFGETHDNFHIAKKVSVKGSNISPIYEWLTQKSKNGIINIEIKGDFQKFLINTHGKLIGIYTGRESPLNNMLVKHFL